MSELSDEWRSKELRIAFVPTMGYLHAGHTSLMQIAQSNGDIVVSSIFVNPIQFAPHEDLDKYPRDLARDQKMAEQAGTVVLFVPSEKEMYHQDFQTFINVEEITRGLCGRSRPGHFRGVTTVVAKLFNIVKPHCAVFGQKDAQQVAVIRMMIRDLNYAIELIVGPIVREPDGLAMSSRNAYLSAQERQDALVLFKSLEHARKLVQNGERNSHVVVAEMEKIVNSVDSSRIDYIEIVDNRTLLPLDSIHDGTLLALAVYIGKTRLIDNCIINLP
jgi:pantoate--beta-alanine ligase